MVMEVEKAVETVQVAGMWVAEALRVEVKVEVAKVVEAMEDMMVKGAKVEETVVVEKVV